MIHVVRRWGPHRTGTFFFFFLWFQGNVKQTWPLEKKHPCKHSTQRTTNTIHHKLAFKGISERAKATKQRETNRGCVSLLVSQLSGDDGHFSSGLGQRRGLLCAHTRSFMSAAEALWSLAARCQPSAVFTRGRDIQAALQTSSEFIKLWPIYQVCSRATQQGCRELWQAHTCFPAKCT